MSYEKTVIKILKCIVIIVGCVTLVIRCFLKTEYVNAFMAVVNSASFLVSVNILLIDLYNKFRNIYKEKKDEENFIKTEKIKVVTMMTYIMIFISEIIFISLFVAIYLFSNLDKALCNDLIGILSLIMAISYDLFNDIIVAMVTEFIK
ncbi:MAG: hypothetical protein UGF43_13075 [Blautia sp.]|uniref:hypothetical protein n=1 Tax=Blautia sp. TaxID=1955243 RepID=UPI002E7A861A|nr:hypothetical protein [Blautia sp.]MEE1444525.1 hypothetical protein [Blautia sp.]